MAVVQILGVNPNQRQNFIVSRRLLIASHNYKSNLNFKSFIIFIYEIKQS